MKITLDNHEINFNSEIIKQLVPTFTFLNGRRFSYLPKEGHGFKNLALNDLLSAFKNAQPENVNEFKATIKALNGLRNKGYSDTIYKKNLLIQFVTRVKHYFSKVKRKKLFEEVVRKHLPSSNPVIKKNIKKPYVVDESKNYFSRLPMHLPPTFSIPIIQKNKEVKKPFIADACKNYFSDLPSDMKNEIFNLLDPISLFNFSLTNKDNLQFIQNNNPNFNLLLGIVKKALDLWKNACASKLIFWDENFAISASILLKFYPLEVTEAFEKAIKEENEGLNIIVSVLMKCASVNPKIVLELLTKAYKVSSRSKHINATLCCLAKAFACIDPEKAIDIANEIFEPIWEGWEAEAKVFIAGKFILTHPEKAFNIVDNFADNFKNKKIYAFQSILEACRSLEPKKAIDMIQQVHKRIDQSPILINYIWPAIVDAYYFSKNFEKAFEVLQTIYTHPEMMFAEQMQLLMKKFLKISKELIQSAPDKVIPILDKILLFDNTERTLCDVAKLYIKSNVEKAKKLVDQIQTIEYKIEGFIALADQYKKIDKEIAISFLENALNLQINPRPGDWPPYTSDVLNLIEIAHSYAALDRAKGKELLGRAEATIRQLDDTLGVEEFAKAFLHVDPMYSVKLINEKFASGTEKARILLQLAEKLEVITPKRK